MRNLSIIFFFTVFLLGFALAQDIILSHDYYNPGETVQALASNMTILASQISLVDNNSNLASISPLIITQDDRSYIYFDLDSSLAEGVYTLYVASLSQSFSVTNGTDAVRIKPAAVILQKTDTDFKIELTNVGNATTVIISATDPTLKPRKSTLSLAEREEKTLYVDYTFSDLLNDSAIILAYGPRNYTIPVLIPKTVAEKTEEIFVSIPENNTQEEQENHFRFLVTQTQVDVTLTITESKSGALKVQNIGNNILYNVKFYLTGNLEEIITMNVTNIQTLDSGEIIEQYIWINRNNLSRDGVYKGNLTVSNGTFSLSLPFAITVKNDEPVSQENVSQESNVTTNASTIIITEPFPQEEQQGRGAVIIGIVLIILLLAIFLVLFFHLRQRKEKKFNEFIQETKKK